MNVGLYQSASSLTALERWQDVVTQNISSNQVTGYKRRVVEFHGTESKNFGADVDRSGPAGATAGRAVFPTTRYSIDFSKGENQVTRGNLDLALQGDGFFQLENAEGDFVYTRAGQFRITPERTIQNTGGDELLDAAGVPFQLLPGGGEIRIEQDGTLFQGGIPLGAVGVYAFEQENALVPIGGSLFAARADAEPEPVANPVVIQGSVEGSNVKPLREMVDLVNIARAYEANQKIIQTSDEIMKRTLETLG